MFSFLSRLLEQDTLSPHGICLTWRPELIWTHVTSDAVIGTAYFSIPVVLAYFAWKRPDIGFNWVFWCFAVFIMACGTTHFFSIWTLWIPDYGSEGLVKAFTAVASIATALALWPLLPHALTIPSPSQLRSINADLRGRVEERDAALVALKRESAERERAQDMLRHAQKMEAIGQLTAGVAHDFNNLLTAVLMNLERAERELGRNPGQAGPAIANATIAADRAAKLTAQMLAFARKQQLQPTEIDPNQLIHSITTMLEGAVGKRNRLVLDLASTERIFVDSNQLENSLVNLAVNARDAMPEGGTVTISTADSFERSENGELIPRVVIALSDTGTGMSEDVMARAFEPFFTTKAVGQGSGLGLSQVLGFAEQSGGQATLDSKEGRGTTVTLTLPALAAKAARAA